MDVVTDSTLTTGWNHLVFSWDGTSIIDKATISINNNTESFTSSETGCSTDNPLHIGAATANTCSHAIDQVRIFNRALTADEVTTLYNEGQ